MGRRAGHSRSINTKGGDRQTSREATKGEAEEEGEGEGEGEEKKRWGRERGDSVI